MAFDPNKFKAIVNKTEVKPEFDPNKFKSVSATTEFNPNKFKAVTQKAKTPDLSNFISREFIKRILPGASAYSDEQLGMIGQSMAKELDLKQAIETEKAFMPKMQDLTRSAISAAKSLPTTVFPQATALKKPMGLELTPQELESSGKTIGYPFRQLSRAPEAIRAGIGAGIDRKPIGVAVAKGFISPENVESLTSKIPFQEWEQGNWSRLIPRAVLQSVEDIGVYKLVYGKPIQSLREALQKGQTRKLLQAANELAPVLETKGVKFPQGVNKAQAVIQGAQKNPNLGDLLMKVYQKGINPAVAEKSESIYQDFVNRFQAIENVTSKAQKLGMKILPGENPALRARSYLGIGGKVESILQDKTFVMKPDGTFDITGEGFKPILDDYQKISPEKNFKVAEDDLQDYMISKRIIEDLQRPNKRGQTIASPEQTQKAQKTLDRLNQKYGIKQDVETPLYEEAKKYKTADEFVENISDEALRHSGLYVTGLTKKGKISSARPMWVSQSKFQADYFTNKSKGQVVFSKPKNDAKILDVTNESVRNEFAEKIFTAIENGHYELEGVMDFEEVKNASDLASIMNPQDIVDNGGIWDNDKFMSLVWDLYEIDFIKTEDGGIFLNTDAAEIKTKQQLTDIWNEANKQKEPNIFQQIAPRIYDYQKRVLQNLVTSGVMSQKQFDSIVQNNPNYIPFDRVMDDIDPEIGTLISKKRFTGARSPVKTIKGSEREIENVFESVIKNTYKIMDAAERNTVARGVANLAQVLPEDINPLKVKIRVIQLSPAEAKEEGQVIFRPSQFKPKGNVIEYFDNGKLKYVELSKNLYQAMTGMNETSLGLFSKILATPTNWLRTGATITPEFILRNPIRDQLTAAMQAKYGFTPFVDSAGAIADIIKKNDVYYDWLRSGGAYSGFVELSRPALKKAYKELARSPSLLKKLNVVNTAQDLSQLFEQASRVGVYKEAVKKGASPIEAGFESRESTVDFARRGAKTKDANAAIAFLNAGIQGIDKSMRAMAADPKGFTAKAIAMITIPSVLIYLKNRQDPDFQEIPRWQRDLFWVTKVGNTYVRIPKPFLYGQVFGSVPERFLEYVDTKDPKAFDELSKSLTDAMMPVSGDPISGFLSTAVKSLIENATNWNFFLERNIVPQSKQRLIPEEQFTDYTSETAKEMGKLAKYSPAKIENLIQGWFGGSGRYFLQGTDMILNSIKQAKGENIKPKRPTELTDIPLVKGFVVKSPQRGTFESMQTFYEKSDDINRKSATYNSMINQGRKADAIKFRENNPEIKLNAFINKAKDTLSDYSDQIDIIISKDIPDKIKREKINKVESKRLEYIKKTNQLLESKLK